MELWTPQHAKTLIPSFAVMLIVGVLLRFMLGKKELKIRMIPFQILACILFALEIGKQAVSLSAGYDLYHLPFHFCSLFIFALPVMAFYRGKHKEIVFAVGSALCSAMSLFLLVYPNLIYSAGNIENFFTEYLSLHTVAFHNIVLFEFVLILSLRLYTPVAKGEAKAAAVFTLVFCIVSAVMAQLLKTNFANFYQCNIPFFEGIRQQVAAAAGATVAQILYVVILIILNIGFVQLSYWLYRLLRRITAKEEAQIYA